MASAGQQLAIRPGLWRAYAGRKEQKAFQQLAKKVLARDQDTCRYCGFQAQEYQEIVNLDRDPRNNDLSNLATACVFCAQCHFIESVGQDDSSGGQLIYLPEMSQQNLNTLCHVLFCAMANWTGYADTAQEVYRLLRVRCQIVEKKLGMGTSNPSALGRLILEYQAKQGNKIKQDFLQPLRLLPSYTKFKGHLDTWARSAAKELEVNRQ